MQNQEKSALKRRAAEPLPLFLGALCTHSAALAPETFGGRACKGSYKFATANKGFQVLKSAYKPLWLGGSREALVDFKLDLMSLRI